MLPSNLNLSIGKTKGYNNKILVGNTDMKIGSNRDINKDHKKLPPDSSKIVIPAIRRDLKMLTKKHNDEKLAITFLIVGTGVIAYHFWYKNKWHYYSQSFPPSLGMGLMQQRLAALALRLVCSSMMVGKNAKDMT